MDLLESLLYFLRTGRFSRETPEETVDRERQERLGRRGPPVGPVGTVFIFVFVIALIGKLIFEAVTDGTFEITIEGLVHGFGIVWFGLFALVVFLVLRKLYVWSHGDDTDTPRVGGAGCGMVVLVIAGIAGLLTLWIRHSTEKRLEEEVAMQARWFAHETTGLLI